MAELKKVKVFFYIIDDIKMPDGRSLYRTTRLEIHDGDETLGYYRIWHDDKTENIAYYAENERRGVLPPGEYKAAKENNKLIREIEKDLNLKGLTIPQGTEIIKDGMLIGEDDFPKNWEGWFEDELIEIKPEDAFKIDK